MKCLLSLKTSDAITKAKQLLGVLDQSFPDKLVTALLRLEVVGIEREPDPAAYFEGKSTKH